MSIEQEEMVRESNLHSEEILNKKYSQESLILNYLRAGNSISPMEALRLFGCFRLGARIWELKRQGFDIHSEMVATDTRKHIKRYWYCKFYLHSGDSYKDNFLEKKLHRRNRKNTHRHHKKLS